MSTAPSTDKIAYLANVMAIARADGMVTPAEQRVYQAIATRIGADPSEMAEARQRADSQDFHLTVMSDPPSRLANLEDMLMMGLADGNLDEKESMPLEKLAMGLKFTQMDVDMALRRAQVKLSKLTAIDTPATAPADASADRRIMTPRAAVASRTRQQPQLTRTRETVRRTTPRRQVEHVLAPMLTAPWQKKTATVAAAMAPPDDAPLDAPAAVIETNGLNGFVATASGSDRFSDEEPLSLRDACIQERAGAADPEAYCHGLHTGDPNVWGCRLAEMALTAGADWLSCGRFRDARSFVFDREAIAKLLEERLAIAAGCPHLRMDQIARALAAFPSKATPGPRWTYRRAATPDSGFEVEQREYIQGCPLTQRFRAECMDPVGTGEVRRILRDAARRA